jgi:hypothetical protein
MLTRVTLSNNTMYSENTKFELKQFEFMSDILKQLKFVLFWFLKLLTEHLTYYTGWSRYNLPEEIQ